MPNKEIVGEYQQVIYELSERIVAAQRPIRILRLLKWNAGVEEYLFQNKCKKLPTIENVWFYEKKILFHLIL